MTFTTNNRKNYCLIKYVRDFGIHEFSKLIAFKAIYSYLLHPLFICIYKQFFSNYFSKHDKEILKLLKILV